MIEIGYSMVKTYRRCPKAFEYKYVQQYQRKRPPVPLIRGTIIHEILNARAMKGSIPEVFTKYEKAYGSLFREEQEMYGPDFLGDIRRIWKGYEKAYPDTDIVYEASEEVISAPLTREITYTGHLDKRLVTSKDGRRWIMDHKTHKNIPTEEQRFQDYQILMYAWAWNREHPNEPVDGIIWDYIRTKAPTIPEPLKNGQLSQAKNIDTDVATYVGELLKRRLDPAPYRPFISELENRSKGRFYQRVFLPTPSKEMTKSVVEDFRKTAIIMNGLSVYPRHMTRDCSWCEYYRLCTAELRGLDADFVRQSEFDNRPAREDKSEET